MRLRLMAGALLAAGLVLATAGVAAAHAAVYPRQVTANSHEKFALRVPTEKDVPTVKVRLEVPEGFTVSRVQPLPGWKYEFEKDASGKVKAITWSGGEIGPTEFQEFVFQGRAPKDPGKYAWRAWQTYKDGSVVEWTGQPDSQTPASVVEVVAGGAPTHAHGAPQPAPTAAHPAPGGAAAGAGAGATAPAPAAPATSTAGGGFTPIAAYGGLGLGAVALALALRRR